MTEGCICSKFIDQRGGTKIMDEISDDGEWMTS